MADKTNTLVALWGQDKDKKNAAALQDAYERTKLNSQKNLLDVKARVSQAKADLQQAEIDSRDSLCVNGIIRAEIRVEECEELLKRATATHSKYFGE